jgi:hypothetical protein
MQVAVIPTIRHKVRASAAIALQNYMYTLERNGIQRYTYTNDTVTASTEYPLPKSIVKGRHIELFNGHMFVGGMDRMNPLEFYRIVIFDPSFKVVSEHRIKRQTFYFLTPYGFSCYDKQTNTLTSYDEKGQIKVNDNLINLEELSIFYFNFLKTRKCRSKQILSEHFLDFKDIFKEFAYCSVADHIMWFKIHNSSMVGVDIRTGKIVQYFTINVEEGIAACWNVGPDVKELYILTKTYRILRVMYDGTSVCKGEYVYSALFIKAMGVELSNDNEADEIIEDKKDENDSEQFKPVIVRNVMPAAAAQYFINSNIHFMVKSPIKPNQIKHTVKDISTRWFIKDKKHENELVTIEDESDYSDSSDEYDEESEASEDSEYIETSEEEKGSSKKEKRKHKDKSDSSKRNKHNEKLENEEPIEFD